jgi:hypothetical protein
VAGITREVTTGLWRTRLHRTGAPVSIALETCTSSWVTDREARHDAWRRPE